MSLPNYPHDDTAPAGYSEAPGWSATGKILVGTAIAVILAAVITAHLSGLIG